MTIDKQKLQKLLWAEVAAWSASSSDWLSNSEALEEFLGKQTLGEVALELLAENEALRKIISDSATSCGAAVSVECSLDFMAHLPIEIFSVISKLRKDAERLQSSTAFVQKLCDAAGRQPSVATGYLHHILSTMAQGEQP
ncbi:hypothetical protein FBY06_1187 [Pseudomonas sp. SJZ085]|uniref:hypothetical protein n=1 Tax=unclassified Pseudomonas TaxID=196821 RepID=UPI00119BC507|nr:MULTISPECIES: hypothetical protein [unclassified Pseudomonas]TWC17145.1 hypothetical protein FBX99_118137 [Pseudomonas sp. SJZ074]TWC35101.1 hypothetical protein FBY06_1187 [Pseudomonas sp. SJZ085]